MPTDGAGPFSVGAVGRSPGVVQSGFRVKGFRVLGFRVLGFRV